MKLIRKIISLAIVFALLNALYEYYAFERFVETEAEQYLQVQKIKNCDVIYVSESSNFPPQHIEEADPRKLSQFIADHFPHLRFEAINKPASHAGIYKHLLALFPEDAEAKTFVVVMNLRSFGPDWINSELDTPLNKANLFYNHRPPLFNRFLVSLNAYDNKSPEERQALVKHAWDNDPLPFDAPKNTVSSWCAVDKWGDWRDPKRQLADQFIKQYGFVIDTENPRVQDFDAICDFAEERGYNLVFNLLAENVETADSLLGADMPALMRQNANWLIDRYESKGIRVVNNLEALKAHHFTDKDFPTEHYNEEGRKIIAKNVADALKKLKL